MAGAPVLYLFAGPNGSGKSTLQRFLSRRFPAMAALEFVNADDIAKGLGGTDSPQRAEQARLAADARRAELLQAKMSFCSETVFSHESKIELVEQARRAGFKVYLLVVCVESPDLAELRVGQRIQRGGHPVPANKIRERFPRALKNLETAMTIADCCLVVDNSAILALPRLLLALESGKLVRESADMPPWAKPLQAAARRSGRRSVASGSLQEFIETAGVDGFKTG